MKVRLTAFLIGAALLSAAVHLAGQGRRADGDSQAAPKPWPPERLPDGQPDVQGFWGPVMGGTQSLTNPISGATEFAQRLGGPVVQNPSRIVDPSDGQIPYQPWAAEKQKQQAYDWEHPTRPEHIDTQHRCFLPGVPRLYYNSPFKIIQLPGQVIFVWNSYHAYRIIPLDNRPHVGANIKLWMGDGRGHWEGNTLVVDVTSLNAKFRLSIVGDFFSDKTHIVERFTFVDANTMTYEATVDDPTVFTRPWTMRVAERRAAEEEMWEEACHEGQRMPLQPDKEK